MDCNPLSAIWSDGRGPAGGGAAGARRRLAGAGRAGDGRAGRRGAGAAARAGGVVRGRAARALRGAVRAGLPRLDQTISAALALELRLIDGIADGRGDGGPERPRDAFRVPQWSALFPSGEVARDALCRHVRARRTRIGQDGVGHPAGRRGGVRSGQPRGMRAADRPQAGDQGRGRRSGGRRSARVRAGPPGRRAADHRRDGVARGGYGWHDDWFPDADKIVDFYHATELAEAWAKKLCGMLKEGRVESRDLDTAGPGAEDRH